MHQSVICKLASLRLPNKPRMTGAFKPKAVPAAPAPTPTKGPNYARTGAIALGTGAAGVGAAGLGIRNTDWGQNMVYNQGWGDLTDDQRTDLAATHAAGQNESSWKDWLVTDDTRNRIESEAKHHMMTKGIPSILGDENAGSFQANWKRYLPLILGLGLGAYGFGSGNNIAGMLGLLAGGYGLKSIWDAKSELEKEGPRLIAQASGKSGNASAQMRAKERLRELYGRTAPAYRLMNSMSKTGSYMNHLHEHFQTNEMIQELQRDRNLDSRTAAEMITAMRHAQRADSAPRTMSVGDFAMAAAGTGLGFTLGSRLGSLMTLQPMLKNTIRRIGQGLFSGADKLGVI